MRQYYGNAGHFIGSNYCRFHLATRVNGVFISTVGEYRPDGGLRDRQIGIGRYFETAVFELKDDRPCECGCGMPTLETEASGTVGYKTAAEASAGHEALCKQYDR